MIPRFQMPCFTAYLNKSVLLIDLALFSDKISELPEYVRHSNDVSELKKNAKMHSFFLALFPAGHRFSSSQKTLDIACVENIT